MLNWAWKQWLFQPARLILTMVVFAGVLSLAMLFDGIRIGIIADLREFPQNLPADLVAIKSGNSYFSMGPSSMPQSVLVKTGQVPSIADVQPIALAPYVLDANGLRTPAMLLAYNTIGGPQKLVLGEVPIGEDQIVLDKNLARLFGFSVGDRVEILGSDLSISGLSSGTTSSFYPYSFVTYDNFLNIIGDMAGGKNPDPSQGNMSQSGGASAEAMSSDMSLISALLISLEDGANLENVRAELESSVPEADFFTPEEMGKADAGFGDRLMGPVLILLSVMTWLITLLTMGMLRHADVQANLHQYGIQKALGARPMMLAFALVVGGILIALSALPLAMIFARALAYVMAEWNPLWGTRVWDPGVLGRAVLISLIAAIVGSLLLLRRLVKLEPTMVFKR